MTTTDTMRIPADVQAPLFTDAHTPNAWADTPVDQDVVSAVFDLIKWAPTAFNSNPLRTLVVTSSEARERLASHMSGHNRDRTLAAPISLICAADIDFHREFVTLMPTRPHLADSFTADESRRAFTARMNAVLQIGYLILGLRGAGLAVGPMTGFDAAGIDEDFFPGGRHQTLVVINAGYPLPGAYRPRNPRLEAEDFYRFV